MPNFYLFCSISSTVSSAKALDVSYFLGHSCFVVLNASNDAMQVADMNSISGLCDAHNSPMICGSLQVIANCIMFTQSDSSNQLCRSHVTKEFIRGNWVSFDHCVNAVGRRPYCSSRMEVSYCILGFGAICAHNRYHVIHRAITNMREQFDSCRKGNSRYNKIIWRAWLQKIRRYNNSPPYVTARWPPQQIPPLNFLACNTLLLWLLQEICSYDRSYHASHSYDTVLYS